MCESEAVGRRRQQRCKRLAREGGPIGSLLTLLVPLLVIAMTTLPSASAGSCLLTSQTVRAIQYNETTFQYEFVDWNNHDHDDDGHGRNLRTNSFKGDRSLHSLNSNKTAFVRECWCATRLGLNASYLYCPIEYDVCTVTTPEEPHHCWRHSRSINFVRGFVPAYLFFVGCLAYAFVGSEQGGAARQFLYRKCIAGRCGRDPEKEQEAMERDVDTLQERNPSRAAWLFLQALRRIRLQRRVQLMRLQRDHARRGSRRIIVMNRRADGGGDGVVANTDGTTAQGPAQRSEPVDDLPVFVVPADEVALVPSKLELKTRKYVSNDVNKGGKTPEDDTTTSSQSPSAPASPSPQTTTVNDDNKNIKTATSFDANTASEHDDRRCAICLVELEDGDRIGDLSCSHLFHVSCLKAWLKRKNNCPLCNQDDVATPLFDTAALDGGDEQQQQRESQQRDRPGQASLELPVAAAHPVEGQAEEETNSDSSIGV